MYERDLVIWPAIISAIDSRSLSRGRRPNGKVQVKMKIFTSRNTLTTEGEILCGVLRCHINITAKKLAVLCLDGKVWRFYEEVSKNTVS
ncbi:hypothetical protein Y032_0007g3419 [Ancylostoma ceylanicum]|uniref:Uncharacterized protein n=1 Tax=Ancylostoma ceylanicum TaxID=53326 RepID=A0A016VMX7_9BILA|nr:hypothetical protein Y032_0007g3419 [Ancylostoma ceylanicum]